MESVQVDRTRLQDLCVKLESDLEIANIEISRLSKELELATNNRGIGAALGFGTPNTKNNRDGSPSPSDELTPKTMTRYFANF